MAKRRGGRGSVLPLEWITQVNSTATVSSTQLKVLDFDLMPDEIAEIWEIDDYLQNFLAADKAIADDSSQLTAASALSLDPSNVLGDFISVDDESNTEINELEDLEIFFQHRHEVHYQNTTVLVNDTDKNRMVWIAGHEKIVKPFPYPIIVGTNVGYNVRAYEGESGAFSRLTGIITVYFKRRKASVQELNQILLKRR